MSDKVTWISNFMMVLSLYLYHVGFFPGAIFIATVVIAADTVHLHLKNNDSLLVAFSISLLDVVLAFAIYVLLDMLMAKFNGVMDDFMRECWIGYRRRQ